MNSLPKHEKLKRGANPQPQSPKNCGKKKKKKNLTSQTLCVHAGWKEKRRNRVAGRGVAGLQWAWEGCASILEIRSSLWGAATWPGTRRVSGSPYVMCVGPLCLPASCFTMFLRHPPSNTVKLNMVIRKIIKECHV